MSIVFKELKRYWKQLILLVLAVFGTTLTTMGLPALMKNLIDYSIPEKDTASVWATTGIMIILVIVEIVLGIATAKLAAGISMGIGRDLRQKVFDKVQGFSQAEIDKLTTSSLITRTNSDISQIQLFFSQCLNIAVMAPLMCIVGMALALGTSPSLSSILILSIPLMAIIIVIIGKVAIPLSEKIQKKLDSINMIIREKLTGTRVIRAFGTTKFEENRFNDINVEYTGMNKKLQNVTALLLPAVILVLSATVAGVMLLAYRDSVTGGAEHTTGEVMTMVQYVMLILASVIMLTIVFLMLPRAATSAKRVKEVLVSKNLIQDAENPQDNTEKQGYLEFKNVSFTYAGSDVPAIKGLSFKAAPGETTAIIGGTGMGKSTIINLIPRLYDVTEGQVLVDGIDVRDYKLDVLRNKIGFVPQKASLFKGTIDSNIAFGADNPTEDRIETAVKIAQSYDFVTAKEDGFASPVAQGGSNFSGGQKQRLCIARAIVRKPEIYVFDDSFSALDFKTDRVLRSALKAETDNATTIIVAQRISTIMEADRIIVVEKGEIAGIGTHKELLKNCDVYKEIAQSQLSKEELEK